MIWADKIALLWALIICGALAAMGPPAPPATFTGMVFGWLMIFAAPPWVILRMLDWISGGPKRRRGGVTVYPVHPRD